MNIKYFFKNYLESLACLFWPIFPWVGCLSIFINLASCFFSVFGHPVIVFCRQVFIVLVLDLEGEDSVQLVMFRDGYEADVI